MTLYARIDTNSIPDTQSYYDIGTNGKGQSKFSSRAEALSALFFRYGCHDEDRDWMRKHVVETKPGVWGLPAGIGMIFGFCLEPGYGYDDDYTNKATRLWVYIRKGSYLQIWDGIPVNENSPIRKSALWDGDQFIPQKMLHSYKIPLNKTELRLRQVLGTWLEHGDYSSPPPWEIMK